jgi:hypothetical protein
MRADGPAFVEEFMAELRVRHLGVAPVSQDGPGPLARLDAAYAAARPNTPADAIEAEPRVR